MDQTLPNNSGEIQRLLAVLETETNKYENNNTLQKTLDNISIMCFIQNIESIVSKLFYVCVKICNNFQEVRDLDLVDNKEIINKDCSYYTIQIYVSHLFQTALISNDWFCSINIKNNFCQVYKTVALKNLLPSDVVCVVVPFTSSVEKAMIYTKFFLPVDNSFWTNFNVCAQEIDIMYHVFPLYDHKLLRSQQPNKLLEISKLYSDNIKQKAAKLDFEYKFSFKANMRQLLELVLRNCIHKLDVNHIQLLTSTTADVCDLLLFVRNSNATLTIDCKQKTLKVSGDTEILARIKQFFVFNVPKKKKIYIDAICFNRLEVSINKNRYRCLSVNHGEIRKVG